MAKRLVSPNSDDEDAQDASPAFKRARTDGASDIEPNNRSQRRGPRNKGKGRAPGEDGNSSSDDDQEPEVHADHIDDDQFEEQYHERVEKAVDAKRHIVGVSCNDICSFLSSYGSCAAQGVAEHGIIESIEMHQFMCHRFLSFQFGPQINFIIGGKSAVLSAITIALGGKSNSTGRGSGLKSFIREGQSAAEVTIALKNQGEEAYKPHEYGKSILITRRFTKEGSSTWKIRGSKSNHTVSSKREELSAICDHMNIQVDNPMNVLTQDAARQFLSASAPADKYKFFLRGTQLSQLATEYETCYENITNTTKVLENKKEAIPDLKQAFREATAKYQEAAQALKQKAKAKELKTELAWSHVRVKERDLQSKMEDVEHAKRHREKIEESLNAARVKLQNAGENVTKHEEEINAIGNIDDLDRRKSDFKTEMKALKSQISKCSSDMKEINTSTTAAKNSIQDLERNIAAEIQRSAQDTQEKRDDFTRRMDEARATVAEQESIIKQLSAANSDILRRAQSAEQDGQAKQAELEQLKQNIGTVENSLRQLQRDQDNKYSAYGPGMSQVVARIQQMKWYGDEPLGPLGRYVKVKDPDAWADLLAQQLGGSLTAFAVTDPRDRDSLKRVLDQANLKHNQIIIFEKDRFDYSSGEPAPDVLTVLRAVEIEDEDVKRILINQARIETLILAPTRKEAEHVLRRVGGGVAWTQDRFNVKRFPHLEAERKQLDAQYGPLTSEVQRFRTSYTALKHEESQNKQNSRRANSILTGANQKIQDLLQEANEDTPVNIQGLQEAKLEVEQERDTYIKQFEDVARTKAQLEQTLNSLTEEELALRAEINSFNDRLSAIRARVDAAVEARMNAQRAVQHYEKKRHESDVAIEAAETILKTTTEEFEVCGQGATVDQIIKEVNTTKEKLERAQKDYKQMLQLNKILRASLAARLSRWQEFRRHIALRCKMVFRYNLSQRGYFGNILFNHSEQTLSLKVQTDDQLSTQDGSKEKDPRSLSGGEKSFSTICLLLSLWESIGCPLRCLDEFDVFMDAVNRRISMKMMIDTANQSDKKQYILITPQDMNNITIGPTVRVHRMTDPERGQGILAMG
ncbi:hypothetical protein HHX47_DHR4000302 [Lentinula edodes]|nr:hypothetical protein HHX47_DHR4000302 [Lentinula edodes]